MISRFEGEEGRDRLILALCSQGLVGNDLALATELADVVKLSQVLPGGPDATFIVQGAPDNHICFLLTGEADIIVNGRKVATRNAGAHVGEMALVDPSSPRSASVMATQTVVIARVEEPVFSAIAKRYPDLWRRISQELVRRLHQRGGHLRPPNDQPEVFVGCSAEALPIAREIQSGLSHDPCNTTVWTDGVFRASSIPIESMMAAVEKSDFAVLIMTPDDLVDSRGSSTPAARDNCVFELGLFIGALGRDRTYIVQPRGVDLKVPSDLLGVTPLDFAMGDDATLPSRIGHVCNELRKLIIGKGPR